jgi:two-component system chemotaxis response regulator CheV
MGASASEILLEAGTNEVEILELFIDEAEYRGYFGVNVAKVLEIIPMPEKIMRPPHLSGSFAAGIFNHRGEIVVLLDLARWLGKTRVEQGQPKVLVTEFNNTVTAFLVSGVTRIHRVTWDDIKPLEGYLEGLSDCITGVIELEDKLVLLLDLEKAIGDLDPQLVLSASRPITDAVSEGYEPIKVLHVDDSLVVRKTLKQRLEENHIFSVQSMTNGAEAWSYLVGLKERCTDDGQPLAKYVDVVLSDIEMPVMDGYHLCKRIKDDSQLRSIPVVLFSSIITDKLLHKGEAVGADGQFSKPDLALVQFMKNTVDKKRAQASSVSP